MKRLTALAAVLVFGASPVYENTWGTPAGGVLPGFTHLFAGLDHFVTMVAIGIWGARLGRRARWLLPLTFAMGITAGGVLGLSGPSLRAIEIGVLGSAVALAAIVALRPHATLPAGCVFVGLAAIFHGHVHGTEIPAGAAATTYIASLISATAILHACGISPVVFARPQERSSRAVSSSAT
jgi:urease accessory protein